MPSVHSQVCDQWRSDTLLTFSQQCHFHRKTFKKKKLQNTNITSLSWNSEPVNPPPISRMFMLKPRSTWTTTLHRKLLPTQGQRGHKEHKRNLERWQLQMDVIPPCQTRSAHQTARGCTPLAGLGRSWECGRKHPPPGVRAPWRPQAGAESSSERSQRSCWSLLRGQGWTTAAVT